MACDYTNPNSEFWWTYSDTPCQKCLDKWGQVPSAWGDTMVELNAYYEHMREHHREL